MDAGVNVDLSELDRALADLERRGKRMGPAFRELTRPLGKDLGGIARQQTGPNSRWPKRSPLTEARRLKRNRSARTTKAMRTIAPKKFRRRSVPKRILGRLPAARAITSGDLYVRATWRAAWALAHHLGARVGGGVRLPARPFAWLSNQIKDKAREVLARHVMKGWSR